MKTYVLFLAWLAVPAMLLAQNETELRRTVFKVSPQHFTQNQLKVGVERFNKNFDKSVVIYAYGMLQNKGGNDLFDDLGYSGLGGEGQFRKYLTPLEQRTTKNNRNFYQGIYLAGFIQGGNFVRDQHYRYSYVDPTGNVVWTEGELRRDVGNWGFGFTLGVQRTVWNIVFLEAFIGGGLQWSDITEYSPNLPYVYYGEYYGITNPGYQGILPKFGLQIGIGL